MLGDGHIGRYYFNDECSKTNKNSKLCLLHSLVQKEYLLYKVNLLSNYGCKMRIAEYPPKGAKMKDGRIITNNGTITADSIQNVYFNQIRDYWYPDGIKIVPEDLELNALSIAIWYMDDGSKNSKSNNCYFATDGFSIKDVEVLQNILLKQFNIESTIQLQKYRNNQPRLYIRKRSFIILQELIKDYICPSMLYKL